MATSEVGRPGPGDEGQWAILAAAAEAFMESGYNGTSIDDIADLLGATKGRVYHYFRSKADIYLAIHATFVSEMLDEISVIGREDMAPTDRLRGMSRRHALMLMESPAFARVAMVHTEGYVASGKRRERAQKEIVSLRARYEKQFRDVITEGVHAQDLRPVDPGLAAKLLLGSLNWLAMWYLPGSVAFSPEEVADELSTFVLEGLHRA